MATRATHAEEVVYTRVALDPAFDIIRARFVRQRFVPHAHAEYAIGVVERGRGRIAHALGIDEHPVGAIIAISPGLVHAGQAAEGDGLSYRMLYLPAAYLARAAERAGFPSGAQPGFARVAIFDDQLADRIIAVHTAFELSPAQPAATLAAELADILLGLVRRHAEAGDQETDTGAVPSQRVQAVRDFLDASFAGPVTIDDMARVAGLSPFYLIRAFRRAYGLPPYTYVEQLRVHRARQLIEGGHSIVSAALMVGFSDQSHLTRRFKRTLGITPGVIARRGGNNAALSRRAVSGG